MYFHAEFSEPITEIIYSNYDIVSNGITNNKIIVYSGFEFELIMNYAEDIIGLTYNNQCTRTHNIEEAFLRLISQIIPENYFVKLFDSSGYVDTCSKDDIPLE